jgi:hypothetical protein
MAIQISEDAPFSNGEHGQQGSLLIRELDPSVDGGVRFWGALTDVSDEGVADDTLATFYVARARVLPEIKTRPPC